MVGDFLERRNIMKCIFCGAEVNIGEKCEYCLSVAESVYYGKETFKQYREKETEKEPEIIAIPKGCYVVKKGDSLFLISKKIYGSGAKWEKIFNANRNIIKNPNLIYPGQILKIP